MVIILIRKDLMASIPIEASDIEEMMAGKRAAITA